MTRVVAILILAMLAGCSSSSIGRTPEGENALRAGDLTASGTIETNELVVHGTTKTGILTITGGADLAEPFPVADAAQVRAGHVVVIDNDVPGRLRISDTAYDRRVAGVIAGAGDLQPGLMISLSPKTDDEHYVALTGVVYVLADATTGPIGPGDLLTTADRRGHCMKATDAHRATGAVLGKALSSLAAETGLVLALVSLQ